MTKELPSFARGRCPVLPSHSSEGKGRALGWLASTSVAALLVSAIGALAMTWSSEGMSMGGESAPIMIELAPAQAIEAISEPSPDPVDQLASEEMKSPDTEETPDTPELTEAPDIPDETPVVEEIVEDMLPEVDQEPPPKPVVEVPKPKEKPKKKEKPKEVKKAEKPKEKTKEPPKKKASEERASSKASSQPSSSSASAGAGSKAAQNYGGLVNKKIRSTAKKRVGERGSALVSFSITDGGGLGKVGIAKSSGSATVDAAAMDHIRRSAPFPAPPAGAKRSFSVTVKVQ